MNNSFFAPNAMNKNFLMFSNSIGHRKVLDRIQAAKLAGYRIHLICYDKGHDSAIRDEVISMATTVSLIGRPADMSIFGRFMHWIAARKAYIGLNTEAKSDVVLVNSFEWLFFCKIFAKKPRRAVYDVADIHPVQYKGVLSILIRIFERISLSGGWVIAVTSPWFYWSYFLRYRVVGGDHKCYLIENKLSRVEHESLSDFSENAPLRVPVVIAWTGILRCNTSLRLLIDLVEASPGCYSIWCVGVVDKLDPKLLEYASKLVDIKFKGVYQFSNLSLMIHGANYLWGCDFDDGFNSSVLLPNRLYQGVAACVPIISSSSTAVGAVVDFYKIGISFVGRDPVLLKEILDSINSDTHRSMRDRCKLLNSKVVRNQEWLDLLIDSNIESKVLSNSCVNPGVVFNG